MFQSILSYGCCGYKHDVTMTLCAPSIKMYTRINESMFLQVFQTLLLYRTVRYNHAL